MQILAVLVGLLLAGQSGLRVAFTLVKILGVSIVRCAAASVVILGPHIQSLTGCLCAILA